MFKKAVIIKKILGEPLKEHGFEYAGSEIKREFDDKLANFSARFWIEIKLVIAFVLLCIMGSFNRFSTGLFVSSFLLFWFNVILNNRNSIANTDNI